MEYKFCEKCGDKFCTCCGQPLANRKKGVSKLLIAVAVLVVAVVVLGIIGYRQHREAIALAEAEEKEEKEEKKNRTTEVANNTLSELFGTTSDTTTSVDTTVETTAVISEDEYLALAQAALDESDYEEAMNNCELAREMNSKLEEVYLLESDIYVKQHEMEEAVTVLDEGVYATGSNNLISERDYLIDNMVKTSCTEYNERGIVVGESEYDSKGNEFRYSHYTDD